jgi:hypothetical protein
MAHCKEVVNGAKPDLEFYYDLNTVITTVTYSDANLNTRISQNIIYLDKELTIPIGNFVFDFVLGKISNENTSILSITFDNYTDLEGGFQASIIRKPPTIPGIIDPNSFFTYNIYTGSGSFLGVSGYIVIITDYTTIRQGLVYFAK